MHDLAVRPPTTLTERFQACAAAADQVWREGWDACAGDDAACCQWLLLHAAHLRGDRHQV